VADKDDGGPPSVDSEEEDLVVGRRGGEKGVTRFVFTVSFLPVQTRNLYSNATC